jgi:opacity protein-like surface antigen
MMSRVGRIVAALVSVSSLGSAMAADMAVKAPPPPPVVPTVIYNWSGFYIGGELGGIWTRANGSFVFPPPATYSNKGSSGAGVDSSDISTSSITSFSVSKRTSWHCSARISVVRCARRSQAA